MKYSILSTREYSFEEGEDAASVLVLEDHFDFGIEFLDDQVVELGEAEVELSRRIAILFADEHLLIVLGLHVRRLA